MKIGLRLFCVAITACRSNKPMCSLGSCWYHNQRESGWRVMHAWRLSNTEARTTSYCCCTHFPFQLSISDSISRVERFLLLSSASFGFSQVDRYWPTLATAWCRYRAPWYFCLMVQSFLASQPTCLHAWKKWDFLASSDRFFKGKPHLLLPLHRENGES